uniref:U29-Theraphotoxin-Sfo1c_1 n=1 Tax=Selenotholus foelschei TaxID=1905327 RepID=A0A482ZIB8_9ARAC
MKRVIVACVFFGFLCDVGFAFTCRVCDPKTAQNSIQRTAKSESQRMFATAAQFVTRMSVKPAEALGICLEYAHATLHVQNHFLLLSQ